MTGDDGLRSRLKRNRAAKPLLVLAFLAVAGWVLFGVLPEYTPIEAGHILTVLVTVGPTLFFGYLLVGERIKGVLSRLFTTYNVAELKLRGPIQETAPNSAFAGGNMVIPSENVVKRLKKIEGKGYRAVIVNLDTPGGQPVPSDDIRRQLEKMDIPVYTYVTNLCASGGYMIACGTDHIHARQDSLVGSIGVNANQRKVDDLADRIGLTLERFVGGQYKDTHDPMKQLSDAERDYWQGVVDEAYSSFVATVADSRDLDVETVRDTEARVFAGTTAAEWGLVDAVGPRDRFLEYVEEDADLDEVNIRSVEGVKPVWGNVQTMLNGMMYAFGRGIGSAFDVRSDRRIEYRMR